VKRNWQLPLKIQNARDRVLLFNTKANWQNKISLYNARDSKRWPKMVRYWLAVVFKISGMFSNVTIVTLSRLEYFKLGNQCHRLVALQLSVIPNDFYLL